MSFNRHVELVEKNEEIKHINCEYFLIHQFYPFFGAQKHHLIETILFSTKTYVLVGKKEQDIWIMHSFLYMYATLANEIKTEPPPSRNLAACR